MSVEGAGRVRVLAVLLFAASAAYFASYARVGLYDDEGYLLEGVTRLLDGQVIYRDFHHTYAPGRFYLFAALFKLFGEDLLVVRATWVVLRAAIVVLAWLAARRLVAGPIAWAPALALLAAPGPWHKSFFHLFLVATLLAGTDLLERGGRRRSFVTGLVLALALLFRQDVGLAACAVVALCLALDALLARPTGRRAAAPVSVPLLLAGIAALVAPTLLYFVARRAMPQMIDKVFFAGMRDNRANEIPFPALLPLVPAGAPDAVAVAALLFVKALYGFSVATVPAYGAFLLARSLRRRALPSSAETLLFLLGAFALVQVAARSDIPHLFQAIGLVYFVWAAALAALAARVPARARAACSVLMALAPALALTGGLALLAHALDRAAGADYLARAGVAVPPENAAGARVFLGGGAWTRLDLPRARVFVHPSEAAVVREIGAFLADRTRPRDYVLTIPGFQLLYFLYDRRNPTAFPHVRRAFDSAEEEATYIADIERHGTRYILFQDYAIDGRAERRFAVYARSTMDWIAEHYRPIRKIGDVLVLERIDGAT